MQQCTLEGLDDMTWHALAEVDEILATIPGELTDCTLNGDDNG